MAVDGAVDLAAESICCKKWKDECSLLKEKRRALREAIKMLENGLKESRAENVNILKELDEERARIEKEGKDELAGRIVLQNEISLLKAENLSLHQKVGSLAGDDNKVHLLEARVSQGETEIKNLKEALKKEKARVDTEKKKAESEKRRASEAQKMLQAEKSKAAAERKTTSIEHQKTEDYKLQLEELKKEANEARSKFEELSKKLEIEKQRANMEKQRSDTEKAKAQEQWKLATANERKLREEKSRCDTLSREVEDGKEMIKKLREKIRELNSSIKMSKGPSSGVNRALDIGAASKKHYISTEILKARADITVDGTLQHLEIKNQNLVSEKTPVDSEKRIVDEQRSLMKKYKKKAVEEQHRADKLRKELKFERERIKDLQKKNCEDDSRKPIDCGTVPSSNDGINVSTKLKLLKKQLKLEKMKAKHANEVAELERQRCNMILRELHCIKLDFGHFSHRLNVLDNYFPLNYAGTNEVKKNGNMAADKWKRHCSDLQSLQKYVHTENQLVKSGAPVATDTEVWHPTCRGSSTDFISGIDSKLESLPDRSKRKKLKRSGINSALASFSDRELVASQDGGDLTVNKPAELVGSHLHQQTVISSHLDGYNNIKSSQNFPMVAENSIRSTHIDGDLATGKKRKRLIDVVESVDTMCLESSKLNLQIEKQLSGLHGMLMNHREEPLDCEELQGSFGSDIMGSPRDYMKLLDLDDPIDEQRYRAAIGSPLSPTLPEINIEVVEACHLNLENSLPQRIPREKENLSSSKELDATNMEKLDSRLLEVAFSESNGSMFSCENEVLFASGIMPKYFVVPSDTRDVESLSKIVSAIKSCMIRSSWMTDSRWALKKILNELKTEEKLLAKQKVCVLFSVLLLKFISTGSRSIDFPLNEASRGCIDAFAGHIRAEIEDVETRALLSESCFSDELISLMDDFLVEGKLISCSETTDEDLTVSERRVYTDVEGVHLSLTLEDASTDILFGGAVLLATICPAIGQIDFIFEASYRVVLARGCGSSLKLGVLHVFARICGSNYFTFNSNPLLITVLKSLVMFLEGANSQCIQCPFSTQAVPVDQAMSLVLEGIIEAESNNTWNLLDGLPALVELIAVNLGWDWVKIKIVPQLLNILESCVQETSAVAIIVLIGQLGRLGVDASGYDDTAIQSLRCHLFGFLCQATTSNQGFPIQTAIATSLLYLLPLDFESILHSSVNLPSNINQSVPARAIGKWFSSLSEEQQSSVYSLLPRKC